MVRCVLSSARRADQSLKIHRMHSASKVWHSALSETVFLGRTSYTISAYLYANGDSLYSKTERTDRDKWVSFKTAKIRVTWLLTFARNKWSHISSTCQCTPVLFPLLQLPTSSEGILVKAQCCRGQRLLQINPGGNRSRLTVFRLWIRERSGLNECIQNSIEISKARMVCRSRLWEPYRSSFRNDEIFVNEMNNDYHSIERSSRSLICGGARKTYISPAYRIDRIDRRTWVTDMNAINCRDIVVKSDLPIVYADQKSKNFLNQNTREKRSLLPSS
jgi:hypothetical protein